MSEGRSIQMLALESPSRCQPPVFASFCTSSARPTFAWPHRPNFPGSADLGQSCPRIGGMCGGPLPPMLGAEDGQPLPGSDGVPADVGRSRADPDQSWPYLGQSSRLPWAVERERAVRGCAQSLTRRLRGGGGGCAPSRLRRSRGVPHREPHYVRAGRAVGFFPAAPPPARWGG